ncbi:MAG TPA: threonine synthase [Clostridia bacterium]|nr:threonine synthase [Clostridia bacterium]
MFYESTRNNTLQVESSEAMLSGLAPDGGLFIPNTIPDMFKNGSKWLGLDYIGRTKEVLSAYLTDFAPDELDRAVKAAYGGSQFDSKKIAPMKRLGGQISVLELFHGPTLAFKDMALQLFPHLLVEAKNKLGNKNHLVILVATSGDTGKAALEGFRDIPDMDIIVFYPENGTSELQKKQMITQEGRNVHVMGVSGNFDDAQRGVKQAMSDTALINKLASSGLSFSSANSINWGRLVPQIVYYLSAYCDMVENGTIRWGDRINITVPSGNFGNILAAYLAKASGLPIDKLICASNSNNVLYDFIRSGNYNRNRFLKKTVSPSMDILVSSNLERLLYLLTNRNSQKVIRMMKELNENGFYTVDNELYARLRDSFNSGFATDEETMDTIRSVYHDYNYLIDPHTAVGMKVAVEFCANTSSKAPMLVVSTASPFKFPRAVASALGLKASGSDSAINEMVARHCGIEVPRALIDLEDKKVLFPQSCTPSEIPMIISRIIAKL